MKWQGKTDCSCLTHHDDHVCVEDLVKLCIDALTRLK